MSEFKVGDRVSWFGDLATIRKIISLQTWPYIIELDEGGTLFAHDDELEALK